MKYLNRVIRRTGKGISREAAPKHLDDLRSECGMHKCSTSPSPAIKGGSDRVRDGSELDPARAGSARRSIVILDYPAQDRPDLSVAPRILSQQLSKPGRRWS